MKKGYICEFCGHIYDDKDESIKSNGKLYCVEGCGKFDLKPVMTKENN